MPDFYTQWYALLTYKNGTLRWFGVGQHVDHGSDWAGMNFHHGRVKNCPAFDTAVEAVQWLWEGRPNMRRMNRMTGHHAGEFECSKGCDDRKVPGLNTLNLDYTDEDLNVRHYKSSLTKAAAYDAQRAEEAA